MAKNRFDDMFTEAGEKFAGKYQKELNELKGFSEEELDLLLPDSDSKKKYNSLIKLVDKASKENMDQAELIDRIKNMGSIAIKLVEKLPSFAALL